MVVAAWVVFQSRTKQVPTIFLKKSQLIVISLMENMYNFQNIISARVESLDCPYL